VTKPKPPPRSLLGDAQAREIAKRIEARRQEKGIPEKQLIPLIGLQSESGWTKRITPDRRDWVRFDVSEVATLKKELAPDEPGWPYLDPTEARILATGLDRALTVPERAPTPPGGIPRPSRPRSKPVQPKN
jgi:hypothetical protein